MKQLIKVLEKINKQLEINNKISSTKLFIDFKNSQLSNDKNHFYNEFWNVDNYSEKYIQALGN